MQMSNFADVRPARRLLHVALTLFGLLLAVNVATVVVAFSHHESVRWLAVLRLVLNVVMAVFVWRGYVLLAALAERAAQYRQVIDKDLPRLRAIVEARYPGTTLESAGAETEPRRRQAQGADVARLQEPSESTFRR
jgi:hypothetical protein